MQNNGSGGVPHADNFCIIGQQRQQEGRTHVSYQVDQIETRKQGRRQLDVLHYRQPRVVARLYRVRRGQNRRTSVQRGDDARFRDRYGLLLHRLVQNRSRRVRHLARTHTLIHSTSLPATAFVLPFSSPPYRTRQCSKCRGRRARVLRSPAPCPSSPGRGSHSP